MISRCHMAGRHAMLLPASCPGAAVVHAGIGTATSPILSSRRLLSVLYVMGSGDGDLAISIGPPYSRSLAHRRSAGNVSKASACGRTAASGDVVAEGGRYGCAVVASSGSAERPTEDLRKDMEINGKW